jgi:hypothetical protein
MHTGKATQGEERTRIQMNYSQKMQNTGSRYNAKNVISNIAIFKRQIKGIIHRWQ